MPGPLPPADLEHILSHTASLWEPLRGKRLFISGGTGTFGCWLLESFDLANRQLKLGADTTVLTRDVNAFGEKAPHLQNCPGIHFHEGDVRKFNFPPGKFHAIIHAATEASAKKNLEKPLLMLDTITDGTRRMLAFARHCHAKSFLLLSSGAVYGAQPVGMNSIPEDYTGAPDPAAAASAYGEGKRDAELLCHIYARRTGLKVKIARSFSLVGPWLPLKSHFAIGNFIDDAMAGRPIDIKGDGTPVRSYLYAADLTIWLWTILFAGVVGRPYNVGSSIGLSIAETAEAVRRALGRKEPVSIALTPVPGQVPARYVPDTSRAVKELGVREWIGLEDAIRKTAQWHEEQKSF